MRRARLKVPADAPAGYYHCLSRVVDRQFILHEAEKDHFVSLMREYEAFCEVEVLTYCVMDNHFHVLVEVPKRPEVLPTAEEVIAKLKRMSGEHFVGMVEQQVAMYRAAGDTAGEAAFLERYYCRMWNVSAFMHGVKQRFTQWYNGRKGRKGTLWEDRFKSVVVEGTGQALGAMAAYIDLNPVRAGMVEDPKDYRWSGYGSAMAGRRGAKEGLRKVVAGLQQGVESLSGALAAYRMFLYLEGSEEREAVNENGKPVRGALRREAVLKVLREKGKLPLGAYLRCRVRYFCDGAVFGSREFVEGMFRARRGWFGERRKSGARKMRGLLEGELFTVRDLRVDVFG
jgi:putative transposase